MCVFHILRLTEPTLQQKIWLAIFLLLRCYALQMLVISAQFRRIFMVYQQIGRSVSPGKQTAIIILCQLDDVDAVVMVPNCPVCHQSTALASAHLEAAGIPTVIMGCAKDIIEYVGAPRFLFNDLPLGNGAGLPHDEASQDLAAGMADLLITAEAPRTAQQSPDLVWCSRLEKGLFQYCAAIR